MIKQGLKCLYNISSKFDTKSEDWYLFLLIHGINYGYSIQN
jgi:hypothetical protein